MTDAEIIADLREQLAKANAQNLTRDEAEAFLNTPIERFPRPISEATIDKLRAISSLRSSSLGEQTLTRGND